VNRDIYAGTHMIVAMTVAALSVHFFDVPWWMSQSGSAGYLIVVGLWEQRK
jgi:hypothetical protein